jgi:hypothetical protein
MSYSIVEENRIETLKLITNSGKIYGNPMNKIGLKLLN